MAQMKALIKEGDSLYLSLLPIPQPAPNEVLIKVKMVGLCRTDIAIMQNQIKTISPLIPGHEFSGELIACGKHVDTFSAGQRVTVNPLISCQKCHFCKKNMLHLCQTPQFMGLDCHGAFAEYVCVPEHAVYLLPDGIEWKTAAYAEPIAASLAVLKTPITQKMKGWVYGEGRIAKLTYQIMKHNGFHRLEMGLTPQGTDFDFVIETTSDPQMFHTILERIIPQGHLILKSRSIEEVLLPIGALVKKEIQLHAVYYAKFEKAVTLLKELSLGPLLGQVYDFSDYQKMLNVAAQGENKKLFLRIDSCAVS